MTLNISFIDSYYANTSPGEWRPCGAKPNGNFCRCGQVWATESDDHIFTAYAKWGDQFPVVRPDGELGIDFLEYGSVGSVQQQANARFIAEVHNNWPKISKCLQKRSLWDRIRNLG